jgi:PKD repeat protein
MGTDPEGDLPLAFMWNFGGGAPSSTQKDPGAVPFNTAGTFTVTFTVTDRLGLVDPTPDTRIITVNTRPSDDGGGSGGGCTISSGAVFDPILVGLVGLAAVLVSKSTVAYYIRYFRHL